MLRHFLYLSILLLDLKNRILYFLPNLALECYISVLYFLFYCGFFSVSLRQGRNCYLQCLVKEVQKVGLDISQVNRGKNNACGERYHHTVRVWKLRFMAEMVDKIQNGLKQKTNDFRDF